jgi:glycogen debranching enzyme
MMSMSETLSSPEMKEKDQVLKSGDTFCVVSERGDIQEHLSQGVFHHNSRHLAVYRSLLGGLRMLCLSHRVFPTQDTLVVHLVNVEGPHLPQGVLHAKRTLYLGGGELIDRWEWTNLTDGPVEAPFELDFEVDFQDIFEVRNWLKPLERRVDLKDKSESLIFSYQGADGALRQSRVNWTNPLAPVGPQSGELWAELRLEPGQRLTCEVQFHFSSTLERRAMRRRGDWTGSTSVETSDTQLNRLLRQSFRDLRMLVTETSRGPYPFAGTPWFSAVFGRDGLITGLRSLWLWPQLSAGILRTLAGHQADEVEPGRAAEPGKILHEMRLSERAELDHVPFGRYYGAVDSTPLFIILAGAYWTRTGDWELIEELWPALVRSAGWLLKKMDEHPHGFLTYESQESGLIHQGWRDANDAVYHRDGQIVTGRLALVEVQAYLYRALLETARMATRMAETDLAEDCRKRAEVLRGRFEEIFWDDEMDFYVMALDQENRPCRIYSSCPGHCLWMGIVSPSRAELVARAFATTRFWSGWGLRTVAEGEPRYSPLSYHNGSVWPHDTALCAEGLSRYGFRTAAVRIFRGLLHASEEFELRRLPELFGGFQRSRENGGVVRYPGACSPQAWAAVAPFSLLNSMLGLRVQGAPSLVSLTHPKLAPEVEWVRVNDLRVGSSTVSFAVYSSNGKTSVEVLKKQGDCEVDLLL